MANSQPTPNGNNDDDNDPALKFALEESLKSVTPPRSNLSTNDEDGFESALLKLKNDEENKRSITFEEHIKIWEEIERNIGNNTEEIENSCVIRSANTKLNQSTNNSQNNAQYGRLKPKGASEVFRITKLKADETFLDIGAGIGNCVIQAVATHCKKGKGLELVKERHAIGQIYRGYYSEAMSKLQIRDTKHINPLDIELINGDLTDESHREFLTKEVDVVFVNNYNGK